LIFVCLFVYEFWGGFLVMFERRGETRLYFAEPEKSGLGLFWGQQTYPPGLDVDTLLC